MRRYLRSGFGTAAIAPLRSKLLSFVVALASPATKEKKKYRSAEGINADCVSLYVSRGGLGAAGYPFGAVPSPQLN
jgi:hypothetical protein